MRANLDRRTWSYGAEFEFADHPRDAKLPKGFVHNKKDYSCVNSNGIANDPTDRVYHFGGEINSPPTVTIRGQLDGFYRLKAAIPTARVNYRSNLHIHIRVPGLAQDLAALRRVQRFIHLYMPKAFPIIEPIPKPSNFDYPRAVEFEGALRRYKRRLVSHQTLLTQVRLAYQLRGDVTTVDNFFAREVPAKGKRVLWHLQPRLCVNLRQLRETDTIEFRHFPGTLDPEKFRTCLIWCSMFLHNALIDRVGGMNDLLDWARQQTFPEFLPYVHWMEVRYRETCHDGTRTLAEIKVSIERILREDACPRPVSR